MTPTPLMSKCLDLVAEGKPLPGGVQCGPGQAATTGVIVGNG